MARERDMRDAVTQWLRSSGHTVVHEVSCVHQGWTCDVVGVRFPIRPDRRIPRPKSAIAVELKLSDIAGVIHQAQNNRYAVRLSYAAMPAEFCQRMRPRTYAKFRDVGVGLLAVDLATDVAEVIEVIEPVPQPGVIADRLRRLVWRRRFELTQRIG